MDMDGTQEGHSGTHYGLRQDLDVRAAIERYAIDGATTGQIVRLLSADGRFTNRIPSTKTISRIANQCRQRDPSGLWSFADESTGDSPSVLRALASLIVETEGQITWLTRDEARMIGRIDRVAPHLAAADMWRLARLYLLRAARKEPTKDLDTFLAFASSGGRELYQAALENGWIGAVGAHLGLLSLPEASAIWSDLARLREYDQVILRKAEEWRGPYPTAGSPSRRAEQESMPESPPIDTAAARGEPTARTTNPVSNPVSNDARSVTGRRRPTRPATSGSQEVANGGE